ncbi:LacI family DNA-binding transcriptional regulator, partial [Streptomyces sp. NPDC058427]
MPPEDPADPTGQHRLSGPNVVADRGGSAASDSGEDRGVPPTQGDPGSRRARKERRPTIADVARHAQTSRGTVSFVINGRPGVAPATRRRVEDAMRVLDWTPNQLARSLSRARADALGLVIARDAASLGSDPFFAPFIAGLETGMEPYGQSLLLRFAPDPVAEAAVYGELAAQRRVDGFVLTDLRENDPRAARIEALGIPAVTLNPLDVPSPFPAVIRPDEPGVTAAVEFLIGHGHRLIAHVGGPPSYLHAARRRTAWQDTMAAHGLPPGPFIASDFTAAGGSSATAALLDLPPGRCPTAIV